jgi:hypothetical protein
MAVKRPKKEKTLEEKLREVKLDEAVIQTSRDRNWREFRRQYEDFIFREKRNGFLMGIVIGAILTFIFLLSLASTI